MGSTLGGRRRKLGGWRKLANAQWGPPNDPQIYGDIDVDATALLEFRDRLREQTGAPVTVTHLVGKAIAHAMASSRDLNVRLFAGNVVQRDTIDVFFIVSAEQGSELSGVKVERADEKGVADIAAELASRAGRIRTGTDEEFGKTKSMLGRTPHWALRYAMRLSAWLTADLDLDLKRFGLPRQAFGSAMVTSVGMFGIQHAYAPLARTYRVPLLVLVGEITPKPVVVDGDIVARPILTLSVTLDHRYLDGFHAARLARATREYCEDPAKFEPDGDVYVST